MKRRSILPLTMLTLLIALLVAPAAAADVLPGTTTVVKPSVRVEALSHTVAPATTVAVPVTSTVIDSLGASASFAEPMAMVALAKAADRRAFTFDGLAFVNSIAGLGGSPSWTTWWLYQVNGWQPRLRRPRAPHRDRRQGRLLRGVVRGAVDQQAARRHRLPARRAPG